MDQRLPGPQAQQTAKLSRVSCEDITLRAGFDPRADQIHHHPEPNSKEHSKFAQLCTNSTSTEQRACQPAVSAECFLFLAQLLVFFPIFANPAPCRSLGRNWIVIPP